MGLIRAARRGLTLSGVGLGVAAAVVTARHYLETPQPLESALGGDGRIDRGHGGDIYYNVAGPREGQPLVLLHDFYPGASNFEFRRLYPRLSEQYRVYAPDWLGFGMSEHPNVAYTGEFYATMLGGFLRDVVGQPAVILAHGHAANIAVRCASDAPALVERLILVAPDVFAGLRADPTPSQALTRVTQRAFLGILPYAFLSSKPVLRWMTFNRAGHLQDTASSEERVEHLYASAHQFGGQHALLAYLTGELDLPMQNAFALLQPPVLVLGGEQDRRRPRVDLEDVSVLNPYAELEFIPGAGDPIYEDRPEPVLAALTTWLAAPREHHAPAEDALLLPSDDDEPLEKADDDMLATADDDTWPGRAQRAPMAGDRPAESVVSGGIEHADDDGTPIVLPTEGDIAPEAAPGEEADMTGERSEPETGSPGAVVPGVSDMGLDGPSTTDLGGVAALEDDGVTLGPPADVTPADGEESQSPVAMLPEAGNAAPDDPAEQSARSGEDPAVAPGANIGYTGATDAPAEAAPHGDVAGLAQIVQTPETSVRTAQSDVAAPERAVRTSDDAVDTAEMMERTKDTQTNPATPRARERGPSRATRGPAREPSPRGEPASKSGGANRAKRGAGGGNAGGAAKTRKHGSQTERRKRPDAPRS